MRRTLTGAFAAPLLLLAACGGGSDGPSVEEAETTEATSEAMTAAPTTDEETTTAAPTTDEETTTAAPTTEEESSASNGGGDDGAAAAKVTEEFMTALSTADPELCQLILNFTDDGPMAEDPEEVELCETLVVPTLEGVMSEEEIAIIELIEIDGAEVDGDTATITGENMNDLFAEGFGQDSIVLKKFDGQWYVSLTDSFQG